MGYSASSYAVFGHETTRDALTIKKNVRACKHSNNENQKFCSECGKPMWIQEKVFIADDECEVSFFSPTYESERGVLGFSLARASDEDITPISIPTEKMVEAILNFYKKHDILCPKEDFKVYLFTYHSY